MLRRLCATEQVADTRNASGIPEKGTMHVENLSRPIVALPRCGAETVDAEIEPACRARSSLDWLVAALLPLQSAIRSRRSLLATTIDLAITATVLSATIISA